ncbi:MAG: ABC transporter permease subunit [Candidatus Nanopelagicales bacterium]
MLTTVFSKSLLDRWRGAAITVVSLSALLIFAMAAYRNLDISVYTNLPASFQALIGIPEDADVASLAYSAIYNSYGAMALGGLAIAMGAGYIAGEERAGTLGVLLGNPKSRTRILVSKTAALLVIIGIGGVALWGAGALAPQLLDVNIAGLQIGAYTLHLVMNTLVYGFLALSIGAWTGKYGLAVATSAGVMVISFFAVGLLPMVDALAGLAKFFPWYYLSGSEPLLNGVDWAHIAILAAAIAALFAVALIGINRRDLRGRSTGRSLIDALRENPVSAKVADRLAGSARVSRIWVKTASEHQGLLFVVAGAMFFVMGVLMGPIYRSIDAVLLDLGESLPDSMLAFFGGGDLTTPEGYYQIETLGLVAPIAVMVVTILLGAKAVAGEEADRTMGLLLANPVSRSRVLAEKTVPMVLFGGAVGLATFAGIAAGNAISGLGMSYLNILATSVLLTLIGLLFGALALLVSAATGSVRTGAVVAAGLAVVAHVVNAMADLSDAGWGALSPFHYYLGSDPMINGLNWTDAGILTAVTLVFIALAFPAFNRRDLKQHG